MLLLRCVPVLILTDQVQQSAAREAAGDPEAPEVDLPQRSLADHAVVRIAVGFLIVGSEMLDGGTPALMGLDSADHRCCESPANQWVFGVVLEVSPAEHVPVDIEGWREP